MELAGVPLGKDLLGGLGETLREAREDPWASTCSVAWASTLWAPAEDGLGVMGDGGATGDGGGGAPEGRPGSVGA
jgi:hypothetical protein